MIRLWYVDNKYYIKLKEHYIMIFKETKIRILRKFLFVFFLELGTSSMEG